MSNQIEGLRTVVADTTLTDKQRKAAADHVILLELAAVEAQGVSDHDDEVVELTSVKDGLLGEFWPLYVERLTGRRADRFTLLEAKKIVLRRKLLRKLLEIIVNESAEELERSAACGEVISTHLDPGHGMRLNHYNPEKMLGSIVPSTAMKWTASGKVPVERPPRTLADVW